MTGRRKPYTIGNNALVLNEVFSEQAVRRRKTQQGQKVQSIPQAKQGKKVKTNIKPQVKAQPKQKTGLFSTMFVIISIFAILSFVIARYAIICSTGNEINKIKTQMQALQQKSNELKADIAVNLDLNKMQNRAKELKMGFPAESQIVYLDLQNEKDTAVADNGENQVSKGDEKNINVLSEIISALE